MKVNSYNNTQLLKHSQNPQVQKSSNTNKAQAQSASSAQYQAFETQTDTSKDINQARVDQLRQAIAEGKLEIHPERIASGIIESARELLS